MNRELTRVEKERLLKLSEGSQEFREMKKRFNQAWFIEDYENWNTDAHFRIYTADGDFEDYIYFNTLFDFIVVKDKGEAIDLAIEYQRRASDMSMSWGEVAQASDFFYKFGKRFGLLKEFRENGII